MVPSSTQAISQFLHDKELPVGVYISYKGRKYEKTAVRQITETEHTVWGQIYDWFRTPCWTFSYGDESMELYAPDYKNVQEFIVPYHRKHKGMLLGPRASENSTPTPSAPPVSYQPIEQLGNPWGWRLAKTPGTRTVDRNFRLDLSELQKHDITVYTPAPHLESKGALTSSIGGDPPSQNKTEYSPLRSIN